MKYFFYCIFILFTLQSCAPIEEVRGNLIKPYQLQLLKLNETSKQDAITALGTPTTVTSFYDNIWYYIGQHRKRAVFFGSDIQEHQVLQLSFDDEGILQKIKHYNKDDLTKIPFSQDKTKTAGTDISIWNQLLGNVGRFNAPAANN